MQEAEIAQQLQIVVISLAGSTERREMVSARMEASAIPWRIYDASGGEDNTLPHDPVRTLVRHGSTLTQSEIGCFLSHYRCLRDFSVGDSAYDYMLVLEDDVWIDRSFDFNRLPLILGWLDIHFLLLYSRQIGEARFLGKIGHRLLYRFVNMPFGNQAYIVSKAGAKKIVDAIRRIDRPIDKEMEMYWINGLPTYALFPYPVLEMNFKTTVDKGYAVLQKRTLSLRLRRCLFLFANMIRRTRADLSLFPRDRRILKMTSARNMPRI